MSFRGVVLLQKRIFHNKQFLQKGFSNMYLSFERKFLLCDSDCLVRRFVRYSGARPFRDLKTITHV